MSFREPCARTVEHDLPRRSRPGVVEVARAKAAEHDPLLVDDDGERPLAGAHARRNVRDVVSES